ncbi:MAG: MBL fold metallo-hydrolase [Firmicutes bacterium]|jgi:7,8-dihydropterin-6-yl-methyl-4-(beta-D-ribofuranosyl)aminobenzene 5'-phosphate synthase|nr:MBL fold metallo-hydrolase [Bacillota bacterium]
MKAHILTDNRAAAPGIVGEHGLSVFIEHKKMNILFDTGQSGIYCINAGHMGVELDRVDCVVLSHGHYDHCGGLTHFPTRDESPKVYVHKDAFRKKYALNSDGETYREIGIPWVLDDLGGIEDDVVFTGGHTSLAPGIDLIAEVPYVTSFEKVNPHLYVGDASHKSPDPMNDEQMLVIDGDEGLSVFLGCSHPGIINCLHHILRMFPGKHVDTLVAGMHLENAEPERVNVTIRQMLDLNIRRVIPLHCTGIVAITEMKRLLGDRCLMLCAGDSLELARD